MNLELFSCTTLPCRNPSSVKRLLRA